jgi:hypothetical protein
MKPQRLGKESATLICRTYFGYTTYRTKLMDRTNRYLKVLIDSSSHAAQAYNKI